MTATTTGTPCQYLQLLAELNSFGAHETDAAIAKRLGLDVQTVRKAFLRMEEAANVAWTFHRPDRGGGWVWLLCGSLPDMVKRAQSSGFNLLGHLHEPAPPQRLLPPHQEPKRLAASA
jgi:hypothetical protein